MKKNIILGVLSILLIASLITNFVLIKKLNVPKEKTTEKNNYVGIYYNENGGSIELKEDGTFITQYNTKEKYEIKGKVIVAYYYTNDTPEKDGKCYKYDSRLTPVEEKPCKEKHENTIKITNEGLLYDNKMYRKVD